MFGVLDDFLLGADRESSMFGGLAGPGPGPQTSMIFGRAQTGDRRCLGFWPAPGGPKLQSSTIFCWGPTGNRRCLGFWPALRSSMFGVLAGPGWPRAPDIDDFLSGAGRESSIFEVLACTGRPRTPTIDDFLLGFPARPGRPRTPNIDDFRVGADRESFMFWVLDDFLLGADLESSMFGGLASPGPGPQTSMIFGPAQTGDRRCLGFWPAPGGPELQSSTIFYWWHTGNRRCLGFWPALRLSIFGVFAGPGRPRLAQSPRHRRFSVGGRPGGVDL
jgi:hypothetical protein